MNRKKLNLWLQTSRPRAFPLALSCVAMSGFLAAEKGLLNWQVLLLAMLTTLFLQLLSNLANDLGDTQHGADHEGREGPSRAVQSGLISQQEMKTAIWITAAVAFISGLGLIAISVNSMQDALVFLGLGVVAILAAVGYTMGSKPYGYLGLGDLSVFIFFGWVGVVGTYYLQTHILDPLIFLPASACSFFAVAVLNVNNIRDIKSDLLAGKHTFAARLGQTGARVYHIILLAAGLTSASMYTIITEGSWLFILSLPLVIFNGFQTFNRNSASALDPLVRHMALTSLIFVVLFGVGTLL